MKNLGVILERRWAKRWNVMALSLLCCAAAQVFAKPAGCPCNPCTCGTCHCGGGVGSSSGKSGKHHHDQDHAGGVGGGGTVDLGGVGQRHREADPFAGGGSDAPKTSHTREKHVATAKKHEKEGETASNPFQDVQLTGSQAKALAPGETTPAHD